MEHENPHPARWCEWGLLLYVVGNDILLLILLHNNSLKSVLIMALVFLLLMLFNDGFQSLIVADSGIKGQLLRRKKF